MIGARARDLAMTRVKKPVLLLAMVSCLLLSLTALFFSQRYHGLRGIAVILLLLAMYVTRERRRVIIRDAQRDPNLLPARVGVWRSNPTILMAILIGVLVVGAALFLWVSKLVGYR
jgi:hypothetical protein